MQNKLRLGVNIDHVATIRNARGGRHPDLLRAAQIAVNSGADVITAHLREDRRHIRDEDIEKLINEIETPINLEIAPTQEMVKIAVSVRPYAVCLVPEKREELTTEGGLDVAAQFKTLELLVNRLAAAGIRVSLFVDPEEFQLEAAHKLGVPAIELHTGQYCDAGVDDREYEVERLRRCAAVASGYALECHAGHGLTFDNVGSIALIPEVKELNIGHYLIGEAIFIGLAEVVQRMRFLMDDARSQMQKGSLET